MHGTGQAASDIVVNDKADLRFTAAQSFTLSAWVLPSALRNSEETVLCKSRDSGNYYGIYINASNQWVFRGPNGDIVGPTAVEGQWTHVAAVQNGAAGTRRFFINGKFVATGAAQAGDGPGNLWIGQQNVNNDRRSLPGTVDEIRVYDRALGDGEITNLLGPPVLVATSKENHGSAGFQGITIWPLKVGRIEPRQGSTSGLYYLDLKFSAPVSGLNASLERTDNQTPVGSVKGVSYDSTGKDVTVVVKQIGSAQPLLLFLTGIQPGNGTAVIPFSVLWGDVNGDGVVDSLDTAIVEHNHTSAVTAATAPYDLNCDGVVDANDDAVVKYRVGSSLKAQTDTDLALFRPVTVSSYNNRNAGNLAVDGSRTSYWESAPGGGTPTDQFLYVDLKSTCTVHGIVLNWRSPASDYILDVSDNATDWTPLKTVTNNAATGVLTYSGLNATGRYVRMHATAMVAGNTDYALYDFQVLGMTASGAAPPPTINSNTVGSATVNQPFSYQIVATNHPTSFAARNLPAGLSVNTSTGVISGTSTAAGSFNVVISATNAAGTNNATLRLTVTAASPANDLLKYALNIDPTADAARGLPTTSLATSGGKRYLTLTFTRVIAATDLVYTVEVSSDMDAWCSGPECTLETSVVDNPGGKTQTVTVRDLTPLEDSGGRRLIRLRVTRGKLRGGRPACRHGTFSLRHCIRPLFACMGKRHLVGRRCAALQSGAQPPNNLFLSNLARCGQ